MMKTDVKIIICSASLFLCLLSNFARADADWSYKSRYKVSFPVIEKWEGSVITELRYKDDMSDHHYSHLDVALSYDFLDWLEIGTNYRYIKRSIPTIEWKRENRPSIYAELKWNWADFELSNNNKLEYRIVEDFHDRWRYKNKLKIEYPVEWTSLNISPYVSEVIFLDFDAGQLSGYRLEGGFSMQLLENSELNIAYQFGNDKVLKNWIDRNYLITYLKISF